LHVRELFFLEKAIPRTDLLAIVAHVLSISRERVLMEPERSLSAGDRARIEDLVGRRKEGEPLAYLTGKREFFSESFSVDEHVLIPRPETELLVEEALSFVRSLGRPARVLDMGTGSGIIGTLLAKGGAGAVLCVDISFDAILVARRNAIALGAGERTLFLASDLFSSIRKNEAFDVICANLPYVGRDEWESLMVDVRLFEPEKALLGGETGIELYTRFFREAIGFLKPGGAMLCEIGSDDQADRLTALMRDAGLSVNVKKDLAGQSRLVRGVWISSS
jgi:release factor glutamine methyltransferase